MSQGHSLSPKERLILATTIVAGIRANPNGHLNAASASEVTTQAVQDLDHLMLKIGCTASVTLDEPVNNSEGH